MVFIYLTSPGATVTFLTLKLHTFTIHFTQLNKTEENYLLLLLLLLLVMTSSGLRGGYEAEEGGGVEASAPRAH